MKLHKLLNGVLACTMALSMVTVASATEFTLNLPQDESMLITNGGTHIAEKSKLVLHEESNKTIEVNYTGDSLSNEKVLEIINAISLDNQIENQNLAISKVNITATNEQSEISAFSLSREYDEVITYNVEIETQFSSQENSSQISVLSVYDKDYNKGSSEELKYNGYGSLTVNWSEYFVSGTIYNKVIHSILGRYNLGNTEAESIHIFSSNKSYALASTTTVNKTFNYWECVPTYAGLNSIGTFRDVLTLKLLVIYPDNIVADYVTFTIPA